jgi:hypothetical protein
MADKTITVTTVGARETAEALRVAAAEYAHTKAKHYADPGYQSDGKKRYALDSESECRAAWSYISMPKNAAKYSSEDLAKVKAAIKAAGRKYGIDFAEDVKAAAPVVAGSLHGVELARPGTYQLASGSQTFTEQMLHDAARYATRAGARPSPVKIGHTDKRFVGDGEPALGWLGNLRVEDFEGPVLVGDIDDMPDWLAAAAASAWPNRSVEGWTDYQADDGETYSFVIDGLALLGVTPPGISSIRSLRDLPAALGVAASARICASFGAPIAPVPEAEEIPEVEESGMDPAKFREALGLAPDASDDEVRAAFSAALPPPTPAPEPVQASLFETPAPAKAEPVKPELPGVIRVEASAWEAAQDRIKKLEAQEARRIVAERDEVITQAIRDGKLAPARREHWVRLWNADPDGARQALDGLAKNVIPVMASGYAGEDEADLDAEWAHLFGPKEASRG